MVANDMLADACRRHPTRFAGLAAVAPQDPARAARETDRAIGTLGLSGIIINSHTHGEYLDDAKFWPILEAAVAHDVAIYLHPTIPSAAMIEPYSNYGMMGALWGVAKHSFSDGHAALRMAVAAITKAARRTAAAERRLEAVRARSDMREWVVNRRERTRQLIEHGGLVAKAGLVDLTGDDRAVIYGALLAVADRLRDEHDHAIALWGRRRHRAFEAEAVSQHRLSEDRSAPG